MEIRNIVAIVKMDKPFNLETLNSRIPNSEFVIYWLKMRLEPENYYVAFYGSGKFILTGIDNFEELDNVIKRVLNILKTLEIPNKFDCLEIANLVCTDELGFKISLDNIITSLNPSTASYEPELYPGLYYKDVDGVHFTLFSTGKIIMTGLKDVKIAKKKMKDFKTLINKIK